MINRFVPFSIWYNACYPVYDISGTVKTIQVCELTRAASDANDFVFDTP